jgi:tripeptide aminopeptidase
MVNRDRLLNEFLELLKTLKFKVIEDRTGEIIGGNSGNLIANLATTIPEAPVLLLSAHMDCVEPCSEVKPVIADDIVRSSGSTILGGDDKAGLAAIMEALRIIEEEKFDHGGIQVIFTVGEEGGLNGSKNIDHTLLRANLGYVLDSSSPPGTVIVKAPGENSISVKIFGRAAHAGIAPEKGLNAIILASNALCEIRDGRIDEETTSNVGLIKGGLATNIVPEIVEITGGIRSQSATKLKLLTQDILDTIKRVVNTKGGRVETSVENLYDPYALTSDMPVVTVAVAALRTLDLEPVLRSTGGGSDANYFNVFGIPCAVLGIGTQKVHTTSECITIDDLCKTAELVVEIIRQASRPVSTH